MAVLSILKCSEGVLKRLILPNRITTRSLLQRKIVYGGQLRQMGGGGEDTMFVTATRWQWHKFKDLLHYYVMVGVIPVAAIIFYANVFIGPAQLTEIPEGYEPKHWEYFRVHPFQSSGYLIGWSHGDHRDAGWEAAAESPISRFFARYLYPSPQQEYEKLLHYMYEEEEKRQMRLLEWKVNKLMSERGDYKAYYYRPITAKYHRVMKENYEQQMALQGDQ